MSVWKNDHVIKNYFLNKQRFADMMNAICFDGQQVISAYALYDHDREETLLLHDEWGIERHRDMIMKFDHQGIYVLMAMEAQSEVDHTMVIRCLLYDALGFALQEKRNRSVKKKLMPIITVVFYYGEREWNAKTSLLERMDIPSSLKRYQNDWKIHVVDMKKISLSLFQNEDNYQLIRGLQSFYHEDLQELKSCLFQRDIAIALASLIGKREVLEILNQEKGEKISMYAILEKFKKEGLSQGEKNGKMQLLLKQLQRAIGNLSPHIVVKIEACSDEELESLAIHIFDIKNEEDILNLLKHQ